MYFLLTKTWATRVPPCATTSSANNQNLSSTAVLRLLSILFVECGNVATQFVSRTFVSIAPYYLRAAGEERKKSWK